MEQQQIGLGTLENDGTGDGLRDGRVKINANFDELYLTNVIHVNSAADFPDAVSGVRELVPVSGQKYVYILASTTIDMGSDRFTITDGAVVIRGAHRTGSLITSTTSGNFFTSVDSGFFQEYFVVNCPNACVINFSAPVEEVSFANQNLIVLDCDSVFTIAEAFTSSFRTLTVVDAQTNGILWTGTGSSQVNISNMLGISWTGTLLDLGTATFDLITIATGSRFLSPVGTTILNGAASSANLTADGRGIVDSNLFNGLGTALSGLTTQDLKYTFHNNIFVDNSTKNTEVVAGDYLSASQTVTIGTIGLFVAVGGTNWLSETALRFTASTAGLFTYIGLETVDVTVMAVSTVEKVGGGSDTICSEIAKNGTVEGKTIGCTESTAPTGITSMGLFELATGDTIQLFVANEDSTSNIIVSNSNVIITQR